MLLHTSLFLLALVLFGIGWYLVYKWNTTDWSGKIPSGWIICVLGTAFILVSQFVFYTLEVTVPEHAWLRAKILKQSESLSVALPPTELNLEGSSLSWKVSSNDASWTAVTIEAKDGRKETHVLPGAPGEYQHQILTDAKSVSIWTGGPSGPSATAKWPPPPEGGK